MGIILIIVGTVTSLYGVLNILGWTKNDLLKDSALDKKILSEKDRYFIGRYFSGIKFLAAGLGAIVLGIIFFK